MAVRVKCRVLLSSLVLRKGAILFLRLLSRLRLPAPLLIRLLR